MPPKRTVPTIDDILAASPDTPQYRVPGVTGQSSAVLGNVLFGDMDPDDVPAVFHNAAKRGRDGDSAAQPKPRPKALSRHLPPGAMPLGDPSDRPPLVAPLQLSKPPCQTAGTTAQYSSDANAAPPTVQELPAVARTVHESATTRRAPRPALSADTVAVSVKAVVRGSYAALRDPVGPQQPILGPYREPYAVQRAMHATLTKAFCDGDRVVCAEVPTGCGKTVVLLQSALAFQHVLRTIGLSGSERLARSAPAADAAFGAEVRRRDKALSARAVRRYLERLPPLMALGGTRSPPPSVVTPPPPGSLNAESVGTAVETEQAASLRRALRSIGDDDALIDAFADAVAEEALEESEAVDGMGLRDANAEDVRDGWALSSEQRQALGFTKHGAPARGLSAAAVNAMSLGGGKKERITAEPPVVFFSTRTHAQVQQAIHELGRFHNVHQHAPVAPDGAPPTRGAGDAPIVKTEVGGERPSAAVRPAVTPEAAVWAGTAARPKMNVLASRDRLCVSRRIQGNGTPGSGVANQGNNMGEMCDKLVAVGQCEHVANFMQLAHEVYSGGARFLNTAAPKAQDRPNRSAAAAQRSMFSTLGQGPGEEERQGAEEHPPASRTWDIEDIVKLGSMTNRCPYYASRELAYAADISYCTYNYLLDPIIRHETKMERALRCSIVVFDEAHNVADVCQSVLSYRFGVTALLEYAVQELGPLAEPAPHVVGCHARQVAANHAAWMGAAPEAAASPLHLFWSFLGVSSAVAKEHHPLRQSVAPSSQAATQGSGGSAPPTQPIGHGEVADEFSSGTAQTAEVLGYPRGFKLTVWTLAELFSLLVRLLGAFVEHSVSRAPLSVDETAEMARRAAADRTDNGGTSARPTPSVSSSGAFADGALLAETLSKAGDEFCRSTLGRPLSSVTGAEIPEQDDEDGDTFFMHLEAYGVTEEDFRNCRRSQQEFRATVLADIDRKRRQFVPMFQQLFSLVTALGVTFNPFGISVHCLGTLKQFLFFVRFLLAHPAGFSLWREKKIEERYRPPAARGRDDHPRPQAPAITGVGQRIAAQPPPRAPAKEIERVLVEDIQIRCLDPGIAFRHLARTTAHVVLASGTLSPIDGLSTQLGVPLQRVTQDDVLRSDTSISAPPSSAPSPYSAFVGSHALRDASQIRVTALREVRCCGDLRQFLAMRSAALISPGTANSSATISGRAAPGRLRQLECKWSNFEDSNFVADLAFTLAEILARSPHGTLVFCPNNRLCDTLRGAVQSAFEECDAIARASGTEGISPAVASAARTLSLCKPRLYDEPKGSSGAVSGQLTEVVQRFKGHAAKARGGAAMFAVYRGKVSEGLNFSDAMARHVVCIGVPFRPILEPGVAAQRRFINGDAWYADDAVRAVNQALGRGIRHRNDWAALTLIDSRWASADPSAAPTARSEVPTNALDGAAPAMSDLGRRLSGWVHGALRVPPGPEQYMDTLTEYFVARRGVAAAALDPSTATAPARAAPAPRSQPSWMAHSDPTVRAAGLYSNTGHSAGPTAPKSPPPKVKTERQDPVAAPAPMPAADLLDALRTATATGSNSNLQANSSGAGAYAHSRPRSSDSSRVFAPAEDSQHSLQARSLDGGDGSRSMPPAVAAEEPVKKAVNPFAKVGTGKVQARVEMKRLNGEALGMDAASAHGNSQATLSREPSDINAAGSRKASFQASNTGSQSAPAAPLASQPGDPTRRLSFDTEISSIVQSQSHTQSQALDSGKADVVRKPNSIGQWLSVGGARSQDPASVLAAMVASHPSKKAQQGASQGASQQATPSAPPATNAATTVRSSKAPTTKAKAVGRSVARWAVSTSLEDQLLLSQQPSSDSLSQVPPPGAVSQPITSVPIQTEGSSGAVRTVVERLSSDDDVICLSD